MGVNSNVRSKRHMGHALACLSIAMTMKQLQSSLEPPSRIRTTCHPPRLLVLPVVPHLPPILQGKPALPTVPKPTVGPLPAEN